MATSRSENGQDRAQAGRSTSLRARPRTPLRPAAQAATPVSSPAPRTHRFRAQPGGLSVEHITKVSQSACPWSVHRRLATYVGQVERPSTRAPRRTAPSPRPSAERPAGAAIGAAGPDAETGEPGETRQTATVYRARSGGPLPEPLLAAVRRLPEPKLTGFGAGMLATVAMLAVGCLDALLLSSSAAVYGLAFLLVCASCGVWVRPADLIAGPVSAPIAFAIGLVPLNEGSDGLSGQAVGVVTSLSLQVGWLYAGTAMTCLIVFLRRIAQVGRSQQRARQRGGNEQRPAARAGRDQPPDGAGRETGQRQSSRSAQGHGQRPAPGQDEGSAAGHGQGQRQGRAVGRERGEATGSEPEPRSDPARSQQRNPGQTPGAQQSPGQSSASGSGHHQQAAQPAPQPSRRPQSPRYSEAEQAPPRP